MDLEATFGTTSPLVGMVHLPSLPGAPDFDGDRAVIREVALADARALTDAGFDGLLVENYGDAPYYPDDVPRHVVADLTAIVESLQSAVDVPVGVNVLRNDATAALAVAAATGGAFVRVNVHAGVRATDQGLVSGAAHETLRLRERLDADVAVLADVAVKHSAAVGDRPLDERVVETIDRGRADALVVSGAATGEAVAQPHLDAVVAAQAEATREVPVFVGSGVTAETVEEVLDVGDGAIVGTALKEGGETARRVDPARAHALVATAREREE